MITVAKGNNSLVLVSGSQIYVPSRATKELCIFWVRIAMQASKRSIYMLLIDVHMIVYVDLRWRSLKGCLPGTLLLPATAHVMGRNAMLHSHLILCTSHRVLLPALKRAILSVSSVDLHWSSPEILEPVSAIQTGPEGAFKQWRAM